MNELPVDELLNDFKFKARITWEDNDPDLANLIIEADAYLRGLTNAKFEYDKSHWVKTLLLERARYDYHNALEEFEENFKDELKRLILEVAIGRVGSLIEQANP